MGYYNPFCAKNVKNIIDYLVFTSNRAYCRGMEEAIRRDRNSRRAIRLINKISGNSLTGDVWRVALEARDDLKSSIICMKSEVDYMQSKFENLDKLIVKMEDSWGAPKDD